MEQTNYEPMLQLRDTSSNDSTVNSIQGNFTADCARYHNDPTLNTGDWQEGWDLQM